jgi:hypothetical protein
VYLRFQCRPDRTGPRERAEAIAIAAHFTPLSEWCQTSCRPRVGATAFLYQASRYDFAR